MPESIFDLVTAKAVAEYWEQQQSNMIPYIGDALFPSARHAGLTLKWIKGKDSLPVALSPSAFDTKPTMRGRIGVTQVQTELPFFREAMRIGEEERQKMLEYAANANSPYVLDVINRIYADSANLVNGALVQSERMRMSLMVDGKINIVAANKSGINSAYSYDYDPSGEWAETNSLTLTGNDRWSDTTNSTPIEDIITAVRQQRLNHGVEVTRGIMTTKTWSYLLANQSIKKDMNVLNGLNIILTDTMLRQYIAGKTGITFTIYDKVYKDEAGVTKQFYPDDYVSLFPASPLGQTMYGTTPEEADLMSVKSAGAQVQIVSNGIAVFSLPVISIPINVEIGVSEIVLPSFERMNDVYSLKVN